MRIELMNDNRKLNNRERSPGIQIRLQVTAFLSGAATMILELAGSRLVAPFFGTSLIVWTALIGIIMTSLCVGNWFGGNLADRRPEGKLLGRILMLSAIITAVTAFASNLILTWLQDMKFNLYFSSVLSALSIFAPVSLLLGMVSPFVARLAMQDVHSSGETIGKLSALNSAGSILGTFMGGFVLISLFPSAVILMFVASMLAFLAVIIYTGAWRKIIASGVLIMSSVSAGGLLYYGVPFVKIGEHIDTAYSHITVAESVDRRNNRRVRVMVTDPDAAQSLMYLDAPNELVSEYTKFYDLAFAFKPETKRVLMLGGGGYSYPKHLLSEHRNVSVDVVELDEGVTAVARKYFCLNDDDNLRIIHEDARTFINRAERDGIGPYDAVLMDTFTSAIVIPFQLTTVEAGARLRSLLKDDGVLIVNVISSLEGTKSGVLQGIYRAFGKSFAGMKLYPVNASEMKYSRALQNIIMVCSPKVNLMVSPAAELTDEIERMLGHEVDRSVMENDLSVAAFTDGYAPLERYTLLQ